MVRLYTTYGDACTELGTYIEHSRLKSVDLRDALENTQNFWAHLKEILGEPSSAVMALSLIARLQSLKLNSDADMMAHLKEITVLNSKVKALVSNEDKKS